MTMGSLAAPPPPRCKTMCARSPPRPPAAPGTPLDIKLLLRPHPPPLWADADPHPLPLCAAPNATDSDQLLPTESDARERERVLELLAELGGDDACATLCPWRWMGRGRGRLGRCGQMRASEGGGGGEVRQSRERRLLRPAALRDCRMTTCRLIRLKLLSPSYQTA
jgi:hypothetical protein